MKPALKNRSKKAKLIVFCGGEGSGKSTVVGYIKDRVAELKKTSKVAFMREPGGTPFSEDVRSLMLTHKNSGGLDGITQFSLAWAQRRENVRSIIEPAVKVGKYVVSDRFDCCTYAYQISAQKDSNSSSLEKLFWQKRDIVLSLNKFGQKDIVYVFLDVEPSVGVARAKKAKGKDANHFDKKEQSFHKNVYNGYKAFFKKVNSKVISIDTHKPLGAVLKEIDDKIITYFTDK